MHQPADDARCPAGPRCPDPHFQKQYSHFCYPLQYLPGKTTYLDTPVVPTGAFTGNGTLPVDAELPDKTPVIAAVTGPDPSVDPSTLAGIYPSAVPEDTPVYGPYVVDRAASAARTIVIKSAASLTADGLTEVPNPRFDGSNTYPKLIKRDYGFSTGGTVRLGDTPLDVLSWSSKAIVAVVPSGLRTGQLSVEVGETTCTVNTTPLSTLASGIGTGDTSLTVAVGGGKLFAQNALIQVDSEVMLVTGGNRSTLGAALANSTSNATNTFNTNTLKVADGDGVRFVAPENVSVENEVIRLNSKTTTNLAATLTTANLLGASNMSVTANTGFSGSARTFTTGDYVTIDSEVVRILGPGLLLPGTSSYSVMRAQLGTTLASHPTGRAVTANDRFTVTRAFNGTIASGSREWPAGHRRSAHRDPRSGGDDGRRPLGGRDDQPLQQELRHSRRAQVGPRGHAERGDGGHAHGASAEDRRAGCEHPGGDRHGERRAT